MYVNPLGAKIIKMFMIELFLLMFKNEFIKKSMKIRSGHVEILINMTPKFS